MLEIKDLHVKFHTRQREAVAGVSLTIHDGEILGLVGESGSGKSVTAMSVAGLLPRRQCDFSGEILLDGVELLHADRALLRQVQGKDIGVVFQEPQTCMDPLMKVGRQIAENARIHGDSKEVAKKKALEVMRQVGLPDVERLYNEYPHRLSGGMRQRVMIAMALACEPKLLIADEPTTALDVTIQAQILHLMNNLKEVHGTAIMFITHDLGVINQMADDVAVMYCGQVVEHVPARVLFSKSAKYSHPYTEGLMASVPRLDTKADRLDAIPGAVPHPLDLPKGCKFAPRCKYCTKRCMEEEPELLKVGENQEVRCFYPEKEARHAK